MTEEAAGRAASAQAGGDVTRAYGYLRGVDDLRLFFRSWEAETPRGRVVLVHGLGEHSGRYTGLATSLAGAGFSVYAPDLRGHGRSQGRKGHVRDFGHLLRDVDRLRRRVVAGRDPPVWLLGQSLGGLAVVRYLQLFAPPSVRGGVAAAPFVRLAAPVPGWKLSLGRWADRFLPAMTMESGLDAELVVREPRERESRRSDARIHTRVSARMWGEMQRTARAMTEEAGRLRHPVLVQVPGGDRVADPRATAEAGRRLGAGSEVRHYPEAYHDLYHDPVADRALEDVLAWLEPEGRRG